MSEEVQPKDTLLDFKVQRDGEETPEELLRVTADGRVLAFDRDGKACEIDRKALLDALRKADVAI